MKIVVLDGHTVNPNDLSWDTFKSFGEIVVYPRTEPDKILERASKAEFLLVNKVKLTKELIEALPQLKYIGLLATGFDNIDLKAATKHRIVVTNIPAYGTPSVAQHTFALLLELTNRVGLHHKSVRELEWERNKDFSYFKAPLIELAGKTLGILGYGAIGKEASRIAQAFGMKVIVHSKHDRNPKDAEWVSLDHLCSRSDVISIHSALTANNACLVDRSLMTKMKRTVLLLNTSRGAIINEFDLADALKEGLIAGAALDVLSQEPPPNEHPLLTAPNCIITPHISWVSKEARQRLMSAAWDNIEAFTKNKSLNFINQPVL